MNSNIYNDNNPRYKSIIDALKYNGNFYIVYFVVFIIIGNFTNETMLSLFTGYFMAFYSYYSHKFLHMIYPFNKSHLIHHTKNINKYWFNEIFEGIINLLFIGGGILIPINILLNKYNINILNTYSILAFTLLYTSHHMINYHILNIPAHVTHHSIDVENDTIEHSKENIMNYGPDTIDVVIGSKKNNEEYEDMKYSIINLVVIIVVFIILFKSKYDIIDLLYKKFNK